MLVNIRNKLRGSVGFVGRFVCSCVLFSYILPTEFNLEKMWFAVQLFVLAVCLFLYLDTIKPKKYPPGPRWLPFVGCAYQLSQLRKKTGYLYKAIQEITTKYNNASVIGLRIGKDRIVMVNSLEANKEMLFNEDIDGRPKGIFYQTRTWGERRGVLLTDGELWKEQRKFLIKHLRDFGFGRKGMTKIAQSEAAHMVKDVTEIIKSKGGKSVELTMHNFFNVYILNTLWTMLAGIRYNPTEPEMLILQLLLFDLFAAVDMVGTSFSHFPILAVIAPNKSGYKEFVKTHMAIWKFLREEVTKHKVNYEPDQEDKDFIQAYLRALRENGEINSYSEGQLVAMCMDMFMAGTETTSKSMSFSFSYMVRDQEIQKKAQEEIDRVVGKDRYPCLEDRTNMPYIEAIVHECIRHFMGRTLAVPHRALRDTTLAGYNIPEDTMVVSNFTNILMDEKLFPDPYAFKPERFISEGQIVIPEHYFPFGLARHRCMGDVLAKCNIFVFTATMLQRFSFLPVPGKDLPSLVHIDGVTPSAAPFKALVVPRM